jgi:LacI family transcriptional regulator
MGVKIEDVSRAAGVSAKTVSRVLNNERYVARATKEKVEKAVAALGYRPNFAARALAGHKSFQIALIYDNPSPYYAQNIQAGVRARCLESGYRMIAQPCDAQSSDLLNEICNLIDQAQLDGVILTPPFTERGDIKAELNKRDVQFVMTSPAMTDNAVSSTFIDQTAAAAAMTAHLIALGHRRIGFVQGDPRYASSARRLDGYRLALKDSEISFDPALVRKGLYTFETGCTAAKALLSLAHPPSAIFASSDDMAAGVLAEAHRQGVKVPEQLSVAGFDNTDLASAVWPPLTTINQPVRDLGYAAADLLFNTAETIEQRELPYAIIERGSAARV